MTTTRDVEGRSTRPARASNPTVVAEQPDGFDPSGGVFDPTAGRFDPSADAPWRRGEPEGGYIELQRREWADGEDFPTRSHHVFSGLPYHHELGKPYDAARLGREFAEALPSDKVV